MKQFQGVPDVKSAELHVKAVKWSMVVAKASSAQRLVEMARAKKSKFILYVFKYACTSIALEGSKLTEDNSGKDSYIPSEECYDSNKKFSCNSD